jgi:hypothetical protein
VGLSGLTASSLRTQSRTKKGGVLKVDFNKVFLETWDSIEDLSRKIASRSLVVPQQS